MQQSIDDTVALREKMLKLWAQFDRGELSATEARVHIGFARSIIETLKVEIAAAHLGPGTITSMRLERRSPIRVLAGKKRAA